MTEVVVIGGGVGGLTAAHELAERNIDVTVYEAENRVGGKARSIPVDTGPAPLHGEHGFRFFPAFYRHVIDTMQRIPDGQGTVADNLVETEATLLAGIDAEDRVAVTRTPDTPREWLESARPAFAEDLPRRDVVFLLERLLYLLTSCQERRESELEHISWWDFLEADERSTAFRERIAYAVQALVALRPELGSARTIGTIYAQLLFGQLDPRRPTERILNGPTSLAWLDPWVDYLRREGATICTGQAVRSLSFDGTRVTGITLADGSPVEADHVVLAVPVHHAPEFVTPEIERAAPPLAGIDRLDTAWMNGIQFYLSRDVPLTRGHQVYRDAPWALTSVSQRQFWTDYDFTNRGPDAVNGVLSVIASDWNTPGILHDKPARKCTRKEIAEEIWAQVLTHIGDEYCLTDDDLVDWFLDPAIVETDDGVENRSPLLVNTVGSLEHRPPADPGLPGLAVAGDYVRTHTDLASMEAANEAGRRAANVVLRRSGRAGRAEVWPLKEPAIFRPLRRQDRRRYRLGLPHPAAVGDAIRSLTRRLPGPV
ncbi:MAG: FAD-dependent oxidoreductase [Salinirussus sp.]